MATLVGIINCTPDSFSDGGGTASHEERISLGMQLLEHGAEILDIGGDSTRPGSTCVGPKEEWKRIEPVLKAFAGHAPCSVDTHHVETAERALDAGAKLINDVSGTLTDEMVHVVQRAGAAFIAMCNPHGGSHVFGSGLSCATAVPFVQQWMASAWVSLQERGLSPSRIILDPGMGAFLSSDPRTSWSVLKSIEELLPPGGALLLGCSRKDFLKQPGENFLSERDHLTALVGAATAQRIGPKRPLYLRVHNVAMQRAVLSGQMGEISLAALATRCC